MAQMRYILVIALLLLSGCSFRMWDPPTYADAGEQQTIRTAMLQKM